MPSPVEMTIGQSSRSPDEKNIHFSVMDACTSCLDFFRVLCAKVVGVTSTEGFLVYLDSL